jgi:hypothetical protein
MQRQKIDNIFIAIDSSEMAKNNDAIAKDIPIKPLKSDIIIVEKKLDPLERALIPRA